MPLDPDFLSILVCPETRKPLRQATAAELQRVNALIAQGKARTRAGDAVKESLEEALVPEGEAVLYPVQEGIPVLLIQEAILMEGVS